MEKRNLYYITTRKTDGLPPLFEKACQKFGMRIFSIRPENFDPSLRNEIRAGDFVYRSSISPWAYTAESYLLKPGVKSLYYDHFRGLSFIDNVIAANIVHLDQGIPIVPTLFGVTGQTPNLEALIDSIGSFPVIVKVAGGQKGVGVMKVDSLHSLRSILDFLDSTGSSYIIRQFVDLGTPAYSYRAIILGEKVFFSYKNQNVSESDFRSNIDQHQRSRSEITLNDEKKRILVSAVTSLQLHMGAVDFIETKEGEIQIFEVNCPFNYVPVFEDFGVSFPEAYLEYHLSTN